MLTVVKYYDGSPDKKTEFFRQVLTCILSPSGHQNSDPKDKQTTRVIIDRELSGAVQQRTYRLYQTDWLGYRLDLGEMLPKGLDEILVMVSQTKTPYSPYCVPFMACFASDEIKHEQGILKKQSSAWTRDVVARLCDLFGYPRPSLDEKPVSAIRMEDHYMGISVGDWRRGSGGPKINLVGIHDMGWFPVMSNYRRSIFAGDRAFIRSLGVHDRIRKGTIWTPEHKNAMAMSLLSGER